MHDPTDRELKIQGITRAEYNSLSPDGKKLIAERSNRLGEFDRITLGTELINTMLDSDETLVENIRSAIEGTNPEFQKRIKQIIGEYLNAGVDTTIGDYYRIKYMPTPQNAEKIDVPSTKDVEETPTKQTTKVEKDAAAPKTMIKEDDIHDLISPTPKTQTQDMRPIEKIQTKPQSVEERKASIALIMSNYEGRNPDAVMRSESDIIDKIMSITDELRHTGMTDETVVKGAYEMIHEGKNVQFMMEALLPENRDELIKMARTQP